MVGSAASREPSTPCCINLRQGNSIDLDVLDI